MEKAKIDSLGHTRRLVVEPLTNYFVARAQQDINKGNSIVGAMFTATNRDIDSENIERLHTDAYSGGLDLQHNWKERTYYVSARGVLSHVRGSKESITATQKASERYFHRPDNDYASLDENRTSLTGTGGMFMYGKRSGKLVYEAGFTYLSPELELNDIGFLSQTDQMQQWIWGQYRILKPFGKFRWFRTNFTQYLNWDFDRTITSEGYEWNAHTQFKNFWFASVGGTVEMKTVSNADLRGGPALHYPGTFNGWIYIGSDERKKFSVWVQPSWRQGFNNYVSNKGVEMEIKYRPINALSIALAPMIFYYKNELQYITTGEIDDEEDRYVVGKIDQTIARISLRMTYMITPNLSIQYWGQPFGSSGRYSKFKKIAKGDATRYSKRFTMMAQNATTLLDDEYHIDENLDGETDFSFDKPDFNIGQFRSNLVIRWEYIPGSTLFLVWTQEMNGAFYDREGNKLNDRYSFDFDEQAHNIFLVKYTYRFVL
jgi:hypothetical protein